MIISSSSSDVVINGANFASLILGVALGNAGINVLIADERNEFSLDDDFVINNTCNRDFLQSIGFEVFPGFDLSSLFSQSKQLLAKQLCKIVWQTQINKIEIINDAPNVWLKSATGILQHQTQMVVNSHDLLIANTDSTVQYILLYCWKLEGVLNGYINADILVHQKKEKILLEDFMQNKNGLSNKIKKIFGKNDTPFFHLKESKLNLHLSQDRAIEAGFLLPDLKVFDEKKKTETSFYEWCKPGMFCMIMLGDVAPLNLFNIAKWLKANFPLFLFYLPETENNEHIFSFFNIIKGEKKTLIVRPDRYIGMINDKIDVEIIDNYLSNYLFLETKLKPINQKLIGNSSSIENYP